MSALYLGTGKLEQYLVEKLHRKMESNDDMKLTLLMDYMRGTRLNRDGKSSKSQVEVLKNKHPLKKVRIGFFHMPDTGFFKGKYSESPLREIFGVHHIKAHVFDNNILMTGANLSEDYFTDRQDRFMVIQDCEPLANYFDDLINILVDHSVILTEQGLKPLTSNHTPIAYLEPKRFKESLSHQLRYFRFTHRTKF